LSKTKILLELKNLKKIYSISNGFLKKPNLLKAVDDISFEVREGETFAVVGESGCGKSSLAKMILKIEYPSDGQILFENQDIFKSDKMQAREYRKNVQIIFQDSYSSLNPKWKLAKIIAEPLVLNTNLNKKEIKSKVLEIMQKVGLDRAWYNRYPHQFSGGQRQRIGIARALILNPKLIICDEPVSSLDVSIQAQVLNLLLDLQKELNLTYVFISHDLSVVRHLADRIFVMNLGKEVECEEVDNLFANPKNMYTEKLLNAIPKL